MKQLAKYLVAIGAGLVLIGNAGVAQAAPNPDRVCQPQDQHRWPGSDVKSVTVDAPEGKIITGYCVKAGSINNGYGPEYVDGLSDESVTITHSSGKDISHYVVFYGDKPEPPFDHNWQYAAPTCESLFVDYPDNLPNPQNANHVNIRISADGSTFTLNWHTSGTWAPASTFVYADHPNWPAGLTVYTVEWVQVAESNYHWQGSLECGDTPPPPPPPVEPQVTLWVECVIDTTYRIFGSVQAGDEFMMISVDDGIFSWVSLLVDPGEFRTYDTTVRMRPGSTVTMTNVLGAPGNWLARTEAPAACPEPVDPPEVIDPVATLSIECLVDSDYEIKFGIEAGSEDAEYILRLREGNGMLTDGTVAAEGDYSEAVTATLDEGMIVVLRINGERIKSVMVPAACPEPVEPPTTTVPPVEPPVEPPTTTVPPVEPPVEPPTTTVPPVEPPVEPPVTTVPEPQPEPPVEVPVSLGPAQPAEEPAQSLPETGAGSVIFYLGLICLGFGLPLWALGRLIRK